MDLFDYLGHQRRLQKEETERRLAAFEKPDEPYKPDLRVRFIDAAILIVALLCFLALLTWMQERDAGSQIIEIHKAEAKRVTAMLADCMNGKTLYDKASGTALFCGKAIAVDLK